MYTAAAIRRLSWGIKGGEKTKEHQTFSSGGGNKQENNRKKTRLLKELFAQLYNKDVTYFLCPTAQAENEKRGKFWHIIHVF